MAHTPIVDADGHVLEPPTGMAERAPAKFRDRIWQIVTRPDGSEWLRYNGGERPANGLALAGAGGMSAAERERARRGEMKYSEVRAGAFRPLPRLADMDGDGIEQAVLYPTLLLGLPALHDSEFAEAQANGLPPHLIIAPILALALTVAAASRVAEGLRRVLDPASM